MTDRRTESDRLAERIVAEATTPAERRALAAAMGEGDVIARYLAVGAVPALVRAAWVQICAWDAVTHGDPVGPALRSAATALMLDVAGEMEPIVTISAPSTPRGITDGQEA